MTGRLSFRLPILGTLAVLAASPYLWAAAQQKKQLVLPSGSRVHVVVQSSEARLEDIQESLDGTRLLTHDRGYAPRLWETRTHRLLRILGGHSDPVSYVTFSPDGKSILTLADNEIQVWDSLRARPLAKILAPKDQKFICATWSNSSLKIAAGTDKGNAYLYAALTPGASTPLAGHTAQIRFTSFSADDRLLVTASDDKTARVWDVATKKPVSTLKGHTFAVRWAYFSPDGKQVLTTGLDNTARVWDSASGKEIYQKPHFIGEKGSLPITLMAAQYVGIAKADVLVAGQDGTMTIHDGKTGALKSKLVGHTGMIREMRRSRDGRRLATAGDDGTIRMWDVATGKELPFRRPASTPTAGEFSTDGNVFWMGYQDGSIRQHDLQTGEYRSETVGVVSPINEIEMLGNDRILVSNEIGSTLFNVRDLAKGIPIWQTWASPAVSPTGNRIYVYPYDSEHAGMVVDGTSGKWISGLKDSAGGSFSADGQRIISWHDNGNVSFMDANDGKVLATWCWVKDQPLKQVVLSPDASFALSSGHTDEKALQWNPLTGKVIFEISDLGENPSLAISPDGKRCAIASEKGYLVYDAVSGEPLYNDAAAKPFVTWSRTSFSKDGRYVLIESDSRRTLIDAQTRKLIFDEARRNTAEVETSESFSPDSSRLLLLDKNSVSVRELPSGKEVLSLPLVDYAKSAKYIGDGSRILTLDPTDGVTIWNGKGVRLGSFLTLSDGSWLVIDPEGRYDASDPSNVQGAHFVLEWSGGLEPIAIPQLKQQFYEPNLFAKILGVDKDPVRDVPKLDNLHLFPTLELAKSKKDGTKVEVSIRERDGGGIGKVFLSLNGKLVATKTGTGFFTFDTSSFSQYLLPETHLPAGHGNLLEVEATNEKGDLSSEPVTLDIGVPAGLKTPDVRLYALCAGAGNYAGSKGDLQAPPSDAAALGKAIRQVAERFLPGHVSVDVLSTDSADPAGLPTRSNILKWFDATAKKSTSSDIVLVFFAGHGVSQIGNQKGYFFLTSEADPSDVNNLVASTATISGEDLRSFLTQVPANKQVVILDTCHSGAAASSLISQDRSLSGDYQRAWESIKDSTGTWMLAGAAADQLSYESSNVDHGMLTYSLLEAIDHASADGLRSAPSGELFVDVERWLTYAANRVESLKNEVGVKGVQRPEFKRSKAGSSFDIGVTSSEFKGAVGLKAPRPVVIVGNFSFEEEDPVGLEEQVRDAMKGSEAIKPWFDVAKHPNVYRIAGNYSVDGEIVKLKLFLQVFDDSQTRKTLETIELDSPKGKVADLALRIRAEIESRVKKLEEARKAVSTDAGSAKPPPGTPRS